MTLIDRAETGGYRKPCLCVVVCPACGAKKGRDYYTFSGHLRRDHEPEDFGLSGGGRA